MINDKKTRDAILENWAGVRKLRAHESFCPLIPGSGIINAGSFMPDTFWNLPFLLAYSVLDEVLTVLRDQGEFQCKSWMLGAKIAASQAHLPWQDYDLVDEGRDARNGLAHQAVIVPKKKCFAYIDAIEAELLAWAVL